MDLFLLERGSPIVLQGPESSPVRFLANLSNGSRQGPKDGVLIGPCSARDHQGHPIVLEDTLFDIRGWPQIGCMQNVHLTLCYFFYL